MAKLKSQLISNAQSAHVRYREIIHHDSMGWMHESIHFCHVFIRSFVHNRCPTRAAALAYTTILALIPILAVAVSVTASLLKEVDEGDIELFIDNMIAKVAPQLDLAERQDFVFDGPPSEQNQTQTQVQNALPLEEVFALQPQPVKKKSEVAKKISEYIHNIRSGSISAASMIVLLFIALSLLRTIESTFNDIWGVSKNRKFVTSIVYYWTYMTLGPTMVISALGLRAAGEIKTVEGWIHDLPIVGNLVFYYLPVIMLSLALVALYFFMPNTKVAWRPALAGGVFSGVLLHYNSVFNAKIYKTQVINYTNIYGGLAAVPLFLIGLYVSWLIVLLGAQLAYAVQNYQTFWRAHDTEGAKLKKTEYAALRIMADLALCFLCSQSPPSIFHLARRHKIPTELTRQILERLQSSGFIAESSNPSSAYCLLRPPNKITVYEIIESLRGGFNDTFPPSSKKQDSDAITDKWRRILSAERREAESANLHDLVLAWRPDQVKSTESQEKAPSKG